MCRPSCSEIVIFGRVLKRINCVGGNVTSERYIEKCFDKAGHQSLPAPPNKEKRPAPLKLTAHYTPLFLFCNCTARVASVEAGGWAAAPSSEFASAHSLAVAPLMADTT